MRKPYRVRINGRGDTYYADDIDEALALAAWLLPGPSDNRLRPVQGRPVVAGQVLSNGRPMTQIRRYAFDTRVPISRSKSDIDQLLTRYDCDAIAMFWDQAALRLAVQFRYDGRVIRFDRHVPGPDDDEVRFTPTGMERSDEAQRRAMEQIQRSIWRGLVLCIKAKFESIRSGIESADEAFLAQTVLADGSTVSQRALPAVAENYRTGQMPSVGLLAPPEDV